MPIYEYRCRDCGVVLEKLQKLSDPPIAVCEACGGPVDKLVSQTAFAFKGTGWYVTDYAKKSASAPSKDGDTEKSASAKGEKDSAKGEKSEKQKSEKSESADGAKKSEKSEPAAATPSPASSPAAPAAPSSSSSSTPSTTSTT